MNYLEIYNKANIVKNIPLLFEGRKLPKGMSASVVLVRVQYDKPIGEFEKSMDLVLKGLKKEGYDERERNNKRMLDIDARSEKAKQWKKGDQNSEGNLIEKPKSPTPEELSEADEIRKGKEDFDKEYDELLSEYNKARDIALENEVDLKERKLTSEEFAEVIEMIGSEGNIKVNGKDVLKEHFINLIGILFVE